MKKNILILISFISLLAYGSDSWPKEKIKQTAFKLTQIKKQEERVKAKSMCEDSDEGIDGFTPGYVEDYYRENDLGPMEISDVCDTWSNGKTYVVEGYCENNEVKAIAVECEYGCNEDNTACE